MERRELLRWLSATAALECVGALAPGDLLALGRRLHAQRAGAQGLRALDARQGRTVTIAAERIIPATDTPGATDANVVAFVDRLLADWYTPAERDRVLAGLRALDERCRARAGRDFAGCAEADQVAALEGFDEEVTALRRAGRDAEAGAHWFAMLKWATVFGYCTSEVAMTRTLGAWPMPGRYEACAPVVPRRAEG